MERRARVEAIVAPLVAGLVVLITLLGLIGTAIRDPRPHDIPVGIVGPEQATSQLTAGLRFTDAFALELDGKAGAKGVTFNTSRRVPDGYVFGLVKENSVNKMTLLPEPGQQVFEDGYKLQDNSGLVFSVDYPCAMIWTNRANTTTGG